MRYGQSAAEVKWGLEKAKTGGRRVLIFCPSRFPMSFLSTRLHQDEWGERMAQAEIAVLQFLSNESKTGEL